MEITHQPKGIYLKCLITGLVLLLCESTSK
jgi:hypothetical protein